MLRVKNFRTIALALSYLCLVALLCLKVLVPFIHAQDYHEHDHKHGVSISSAESCLSCDLEHAAFLFAIETVQSFDTLIACLGTLIFLAGVCAAFYIPTFSLLRAPPALS
jgi:hypothetical protein